MKNNFDLKKFLIENKLTANSRLVNEGVDYIKIADPSKVEDAFETINSEYRRMGLEFDIIEPDTISISNASPANVSDIIQDIEQEGIQVEWDLRKKYNK